jgi:hypothetical protein
MWIPVCKKWIFRSLDWSKPLGHIAGHAPFLLSHAGQNPQILGQRPVSRFRQKYPEFSVSLRPLVDWASFFQQILVLAALVIRGHFIYRQLKCAKIQYWPYFGYCSLDYS